MKCCSAMFILFLFAFQNQAQDLKCSFPFQQSFHSSKSAINRDNEIIIPIVFHVFAENGGEDIPISLIEQQVHQLNQDLNALNDDLGEAPVEAVPNIGRTSITFKIAEIDPDGQTTTGIIRLTSPQSQFGDLQDENGISLIKQSEMGGSDPWNTEKYINIWIGERTISLGETINTLSKSEDIEGIILDVNVMTSAGRTLTHEMGHFLGLLHPWGNFTGCDGEDDGIDDTPFQAFPDFACTSVQNCGNFTKTGNFMDFNSDDCLLYFTKEQANNMQNYLSEVKPQMLHSDDCFLENFPLEKASIAVNYEFQSLELYFKSQATVQAVRLFDMSGKRIISKLGKSENYLKVETYGIPSGIYLLQVQTAEKTFTEKIFIK